MSQDTAMYNFDDVQEYFEFRFKGHVYRFRYFTQEEAEKFKSIDSKDTDAMTNFILSFISKVDESSPEFKDIQKTMNSKQLDKFQDMIRKEFALSS